MTVSGITISRVQTGKIVEEMQEWDALGLMRHLGVFRMLSQTPT